MDLTLLIIMLVSLICLWVAVIIENKQRRLLRTQVDLQFEMIESLRKQLDLQFQMIERLSKMIDLVNEGHKITFDLLQGLAKISGGTHGKT